MKKIKLAALLIIGAIAIGCNKPQPEDLKDTYLILVHFDDVLAKDYVLSYYENDFLVPIHEHEGGRYCPCLEDSINRIPYIELDNGYLLVKRQWCNAFYAMLSHSYHSCSEPIDSIYILTNQLWEEQETSPNSIEKSDSLYRRIHIEYGVIKVKAIEILLSGKTLLEPDYTSGSDYMRRYHHGFSTVRDCEPDSTTLAVINREESNMNEWVKMLNQMIQEGLFEKLYSIQVSNKKIHSRLEID